MSINLLTQAVKEKDLETIELLIKKGVDVNSKDKSGYTPLHWAAEYGHKKIVELFLDNGSDVNTTADGYCIGATPLHLAAWKGYTEVAQALIEAEAEVTAKDDGGYTPLHSAANFGHKDIVEALIEAGADMTAKDENGRTSLHSAARWGKTETVKVLIDNGAEVDAKTKYGNITPLPNAIRYEYTDIARELIKAGADVNAKDREWDTPLHLAAQKGNTELARLLIDKGAYVNAKYKNDVNGALNQVFSYSGFSVMATEKYGSSPLHRAADYGRTELAGLLIDKGADVKAKDDMFKTPLDLAEKSGHENTVKLLKQNGGKQDEH